MNVFISIVIGVIILCILWALGIVQEFLFMIFFPSIIGLISGLIGLFWGNFNGGWDVGVIIGIILYVIYCITRIINPETSITITGYSDNTITKEEDDTNGRARGIAGIVVFIAATIYYLVQNS